MPADTVMVLLVTAPTLQVAEELVTAAVERRLAACGNIVPGVTSIYRWEGRMHRDSEVLILFKTVQAQADPLTALVHELHPYDVPEVLSIPVEHGSAGYMTWVAQNATGVAQNATG